MQLTVKGKHLDVGDALRTHVQNYLSHATQKYFRDPINATVIFTKEKGHRYRADVSVHVGGGILLEAHAEANDPYPAFEDATKRMAKRLARYKDRLRDHHRSDDVVVQSKAAYTTFSANENAARDDGTGGNEPTIVAEMQTQIPTLAVSDAVMRLELGDLPVVMFRNPASGQYNVVYRRKDGHIGWIDPPAAKLQAPTAKAAPAKPAAIKKPAAKKSPVSKKKPLSAKKKK